MSSLADDCAADESRPNLWPAHANAAIWGFGNGLTSTTLVTYLARQFGAEGLAVGLIAASPNIAGVLRFAAPDLLRLVGDRKWFALLMFALSGALLLLLPLVVWPGVFPWPPAAALAVMIALWCFWHLAMFLGVIALWSWIGDLVPSSIRSRFIGVRQGWLMAGQILGVVAAAVITWQLQTWTESDRWPTLAVPAIVGALCILLSVIPLAALQNVPIRSRSYGSTFDSLRAVFDGRFVWLLAFWSFAGIANGASQAAQGLLPVIKIKLAVYVLLAMQAAMHIGQALLSPVIGQLADRVGVRRLMIGSQALVSFALLFYAAASPDQPYWIGGAWLFWIAYAGLNVCLPIAMLRLSPGGNSPPHIAAYFALGGLATSVSSVLFGALFDALPRDWSLQFAGYALDRFQVFFVLGTVLRLAALVWLIPLPDERLQTTFRQPV